MRMPLLSGPGSVPWLLRHDLRLGTRHMRSSRRRAGPVALCILGTVVGLLHVVGFAAAPALSWLHEQFRAESMMAGSITLVSVLALFMSKAISQAADTLFDCGDLDLLLSSPLPMRRVLTTRLLAIAVITAIMPIVIVLPIVDGMMLRGYFSWIGVYPVIVSLGLLASSLGSALTFGLLAWLGPRFTAVAARVLATVLGVIALLVAQVQFLFPGVTHSGLWLALAAQARSGGRASADAGHVGCKPGRSGRGKLPAGAGLRLRSARLCHHPRAELGSGDIPQL
jgi:ABC-2 type transport system permease protein